MLMLKAALEGVSVMSVTVKRFIIFSTRRLVSEISSGFMEENVSHHSCTGKFQPVILRWQKAQMFIKI